MPRYHVIFSDHRELQVVGYIGKYQTEVDAILDHPWLTDVYQERWITKCLRGETVEETTQAIYDNLGYLVLCVNLDEEIMKDLNGGFQLERIQS